MSARRRFLVIFIVTMAVVGAGFGYVIARIHHWHELGWTGVFFAPDVPNARRTRMEIPPGSLIVTYSNTPADGLFEPSDVVESLDGIPIRDTPRLRQLDRRTKRGDTVTFRVLRKGKHVDVPVRLDTPLRSPYMLIKTIVAFAVSLIFIGVALLVFMRRSDDMRAVVFYAFAIVSAMAIVGNAATVYESSGGRGLSPSFAMNTVTPLLFMLFTLAYAPLILHLSLIFPRERPIIARKPHLIRWIYAGAVLTAFLVFFMSTVLYLMMRDPLQVTKQGSLVDRGIEWGALGVAVFGLLTALQVIFTGRGEGIVRAFARRPFRAAFSLLALFVATTMLIGRYGSKYAAVGAGFATIGIPMLVLASYPIFAVVALVRSYRSAGIEEKRQVQWPMWGMLIALATKIAGVGVSTVGALTLTYMHHSMLSWRGVFQILDIVPTLTSVLIPLSFAAAILKYRLMNIDVIIRKTVVYAILSGAIIVVYLGVVGGLGTLLVNVAGVKNQTLVIASTLVVALAFVPLRNKLQTLVDRNLFRRKYDYPEALKSITSESHIATDAVALLSSSAEQLQQALQNRAVMMFVERQEELVATAKVGVPDTLLGRLRMSRAIADHLDRPFDPRRRTLPDDASAALARIDAVLVVPAGARAFIALGSKLSGGEYDVEDLDFLRSAADNIAFGIDRIRMQGEESDYAQARAIQQTLIPREMPRVARLDVAGAWQPARTMGGDYYDLLKLGEQELAICIGDVAGKGMPAALLMSGLQAAVRASASGSPRDLCERVRRVVISSLSGGRFVTFFYATLDTAAMRLRWCNAGHNAPVLARADGTVIRLSEGGPAFTRLFRDSGYEERELPLEPGDRILLFTDGVSEARDAEGEMFGETRLEELVAQDGATAAELQQSVLDAALAHAQGDVEDDLTLVTIRVS